MKQQLHFLQKRLRLSDPWSYKVPTLITITYIAIIIGEIPFFTAIKYWGLSLLTIIGIAAYAYLLNDWADIEKDTLAGKPNSMIGLNTGARISLLIVFFALAIIPWFFFPYTIETILLLILELFLFLLYAAQPFRLKERVVGGVVTDALYAHAIPCLLAALTFFQIAEVSHHNKLQLIALLNAPFLVILTAWQFSLGIRNILLHHLEDLNNDIASGTNTFATRYGKIVTDKWLMYFALPAELIFMIVFFACLTYFSFIFSISYVVFMAYVFIFKGNRSLDLRGFCYIFLDDYYMDWFPVAALITLICIDWHFVFLFLAHVFLFRNILRALYRQYVTND